MFGTGRGRQLKSLTATQMASMQTRFSKIADTMNRMDQLTGGQLRKTATREGWNVGQMMERFEIQEEERE